MILLTIFFAWFWCESQKELANNINKEEVNRYKIKVIFWAILAFLPMFLINALMKNVGTDYGNYYVYYQRIVSGNEQEVEITYKLICLLVNKLGLEFQWVYVIYSLMSYGLLSFCLKKYSKNYAVSYLMFFLNGYFATLGLHQIRQFTAVMLVFWGLSYIKSHEFLKYLGCVLLATTFHFTAIIMLPFYWILGKKWKSTAFIMVAIILLPFNLFYTEIMTWLFATFLPRYLNTNYTTRGFGVSALFLGLILLPLLISILYEKMCEEEHTIFKNCMYFSSILVLFGSWLPEYKRFVYYFFIPSIVYIPTLLESDKNKWRKRIFYVILLGFYAVYFMKTFNEWSIAPYRSVLN